MASGPNPISITIGGDAKPLVDAAKQAQGALANLSQQAAGTSLGADSATRGMGGLLERLKEYRREETQQARSTRFFANELQGLVPVGSSAAGAISKLALVIGGGFGIGSAIELAKWGIEAFVASEREAAEESRKLAQEVSEMWDRINSATAKAQAALRERPKTDIEKEADQAAAGYVAELDKVKEAILTKQRERDAAVREEDASAAAKAITAIQELEKRKAEILAEGQRVWLQARDEAEDRDVDRRAEEAKKAAYENDLRVGDEKVRARREARAKEEAEDKAYAAKFFTNAKTRAQQEEEARVAIFRDGETARFEAQKQADEKEIAWRQRRADADREIERQLAKDTTDMVGGAMSGLAREAVASFRPMLTQSAAYARAMRAAGKEIEDTSDLSGPAFAALAQNALAGLAVEAGTKALFYTAEGIALSLTPGMQAQAATKFIAAGIMAGIAGGAGGGAYAIGQNRGMTAAERQQTEVAAGGGGGSGGGSFSSGRSGGESIVRETRIVFLPPLMTEAEAAQWVTRAGTVAERLDLARREA